MMLNPIPALFTHISHHLVLKQNNLHMSSCVCCLRALPGPHGSWSSGSPVGMFCRLWSLLQHLTLAEMKGFWNDLWRCAPASSVLWRRFPLLRQIPN
jgi:hypothetical protein